MDDKMKLAGVFVIDIIRVNGDKESIVFNNGITNAARDALLNIMFHGTTQMSTWYIGLIGNTSFTALAAGDTYTSHTGWVEATGYDEATRQAWNEDVASAQSMTSSTQATFTASGSVDIKGAFIASSSTKGETTGSAILWSTGTFGSVKSLAAGDVLRVTYTIND